MLTKLSPIEQRIDRTIFPGDLVIVRFRSNEDAGYKLKKSSLLRKETRFKSLMINVDLHIHYLVDGSGVGSGRSGREKVIGAGLQETWTTADGSGREHRMVFIVPGFDVRNLVRSSIYISTDSLSMINVDGVDIQVRKEDEMEKMAEGKLTFVSTWGIKCGIATYTGFLVDAIKNAIGCDIGKDGIGRDVEVVSVNEGTNTELIYSKMVHIQHEFGMMPSPPRVSKNSKCIMTFHTIMTDMTEDGLGVDNLIGMGMGEEVDNAIGDGVSNGRAGSGRALGMKFAIGRFESSLGGLVGYIVHSQESARVLKKLTKKDVWVVDHGSMYVPDISRKDARKMLDMEKIHGIGEKDKVGFIFGFQSPNKNYNELVEIGKRIGMKLIISGARHDKIKKNILSDVILKDSGYGKNVIFLDKFLTEMEVNLYALSSDVLLFNYPKQDHYSVSGALHRIIGAGRACILSDTRHFADVRDNGLDGALKFIPGDIGDLERKIRDGLDISKGEELGRNAREYAERTSWENVAKKHLEIYGKYVSFDVEEKVEEKVEENIVEEKDNNGEDSEEK